MRLLQHAILEAIHRRLNVGWVESAPAPCSPVAQPGKGGQRTGTQCTSRDGRSTPSGQPVIIMVIKVV